MSDYQFGDVTKYALAKAFGGLNGTNQEPTNVVEPPPKGYQFGDGTRFALRKSKQLLARRSSIQVAIPFSVHRLSCSRLVSANDHVGIQDNDNGNAPTEQQPAALEPEAHPRNLDRSSTVEDLKSVTHLRYLCRVVSCTLTMSILSCSPSSRMRACLIRKLTNIKELSTSVKKLSETIVEPLLRGGGGEQSTAGTRVGNDSVRPCFAEA